MEEQNSFKNVLHMFGEYHDCKTIIEGMLAGYEAQGDKRMLVVHLF